MKSEGYNDKEKKNILAKIIACFETEKEEKETILEKSITKLKKCFHLIPDNEKETYKISNVREARNKKVLAGVLSAAVIGTSILGMGILMNTAQAKMEERNLQIAREMLASAKENQPHYFDIVEVEEALESPEEEIKLTVSSDATKDNQKDFEQEINELLGETSSTVEENHDFGDTFTTTGTIYKTQYDMASEENNVKTYFDALSVRKIGGIVYDYNGEKITIFDNDSDAEAKKKALENNGAKQIGYVGRNENANYSGYEGFFNEDDVNFINEENVERKGR